MTDPVQILNRFIKENHLSTACVLLGLSGGIDSLCLFYCLMHCKKQNPLFRFEVAHVHHGWREESDNEALELKKLCLSHSIAFHFKKLNPQEMKGNLENACRQERYQFFKTLVDAYRLQGIFLGHQADDQAETILKRIFEGVFWSNLSAMQSQSNYEGVGVFRPFLNIPKKVLENWLYQKKILHFEDRTNHDSTFLRARMRQSLIPKLNQEFKKDIQLSVVRLGEELQELKEFMDNRVTHLLRRTQRGLFGTYLNFEKEMISLVEIKYAVRQLCAIEGFYLSRELLSRIAHSIEKGDTNSHFVMGQRSLYVDRHHLFICHKPAECLRERIYLDAEGEYRQGHWQVRVKKINTPFSYSSSWSDVWLGSFKAVIPNDHYELGNACLNALYASKNQKINKLWSQYKVPTFLRSLIPVVWKGDTIYHEFLTGERAFSFSEAENWMELELKVESS